MLCVGSWESVFDGLALEFSNQRGQQPLFFTLAVNTGQFLNNEFDGRSRLTADLTQPSVSCGS